MIRFACPHCGKTLKVMDEAADKKRTCPSCNQTVQIPQPRVTIPAEVPPVLEPKAPQPVLSVEGHKDCPFCGEQILAKAIKCKHCGEMLESTPPPAPQIPAKMPWYSARVSVVLGTALCVFGLLGTLVYWKMDTTVVAGTGRVHNIGLMDERRNGLMVSMGVAGLGFAVAAIGNRRRPGA